MIIFQSDIEIFDALADEWRHLYEHPPPPPGANGAAFQLGLNSIYLEIAIRLYYNKIYIKDWATSYKLILSSLLIKQTWNC